MTTISVEVSNPISNIKHLAVKTCFQAFLTEETGYKRPELDLFFMGLV